MINRERLAKAFTFLAQIDSESKNEKTICDEIVKIVKKMGAQTFIDDSFNKTGSDTGNLVIKFKGNTNAPSLLLSAHMDTVEPAKGVTVIRNGDLFKSDETTILGADDKSALAIIIETITVLLENELSFGPLELVFTTCEEIGLLGAKNFNFDLVTAKYGYVLDTSNTDAIVTRAPSANHLEFVIHGKAAHAGACPEDGINAIMLAGKAISGLTVGRIDHETTSNIGLIKGGVATNIVPESVTIKGEVRSHDEDKLKSVTDGMVKVFTDAIGSDKSTSDAGDGSRVEVMVKNDFPGTFVPDDHLIVKLAVRAAENLGRKMTSKSTGGGADANVFFKNDIICGVLGTGMKDIHTIRENIDLSDMVKAAELLVEILQLHAKEYGV